MQHRQLSRVLETFQNAAGKRPWDWYAQANYGMILMEVNRPAEAAAAFRAASRLSPQRPVSSVWMSRASRRLMAPL